MSISCIVSIINMVTWQPADIAPVANLQVTVMLPSSSRTTVEDWRPVVSVVCVRKTEGASDCEHGMCV